METHDYTKQNYDVEKKASAHVTSVVPAGEVEVVADHEMTEDEATLVALGCVPLLHSTFLFGIFGC